MRVLHVTRSLDPAGGGPAEGIRQLALWHQASGERVEVAAIDPSDAPWIAGFPATVHAFGPAIGKYGYTRTLVPWLRANAHRFDAVVVNGLWQFHGYAVWRALRGSKTPYFVFTHGMLDPWFKRQYPLKHLKKRLYWPFIEHPLLRDAAAVLFTCEEEKQLARQSFSRYQPAREVVVGYGIQPPASAPEAVAAERLAFRNRFPALDGHRILLFLSRIQEKKGCDLLIEAFAQTAAADPSLHLVMAGPDQEGWVPSLRARADRLGIGMRISWPGMLSGPIKWGALRCADAFVLPSHQENFGIAVVEALACGTTVLISDKVNIWREIADDRAGLVNPDTIEGTSQTLARWISMPATERATMGERARACFHKHFFIGASAERLTTLIESHVASGKAPAISPGANPAASPTAR